MTRNAKEEAGKEEAGKEEAEKDEAGKEEERISTCAINPRVRGISASVLMCNQHLQYCTSLKKTLY